MLWKEEKKQELTNRKKEETMGKVFGYPEFDENGEQILTTYDNEYKDMLMDVRVYPRTVPARRSRLSEAVLRDWQQRIS